MPKIIIVTGTPGVGKTAIGKLLAKETGYRFLSLSDIVKEQGLHKGFDRRARSFIIDEHAVRKRLREYFEDPQEKGIVFESHFVSSIARKRRGLVAIVIRLDPVVLARRLKTRKWPKRKIWENVEAEMIDLSLYDSLKVFGRTGIFEIDATGKHPRQLVQQILMVLAKGRRHLDSSTDWLETYDPILLSRKIL